jgi:hypothetical protein
MFLQINFTYSINKNRVRIITEILKNLQTMRMRIISIEKYSMNVKIMKSLNIS